MKPEYNISVLAAEKFCNEQIEVLQSVFVKDARHLTVKGLSSKKTYVISIFYNEDDELKTSLIRSVRLV